MADGYTEAGLFSLDTAMRQLTTLHAFQIVGTFVSITMIVLGLGSLT